MKVRSSTFLAWKCGVLEIVDFGRLYYVQEDGLFEVNGGFNVYMGRIS
jgi:hypothetical protein